ncbi:MAG: biotin--[acetyl-CoA-carboxylase] ligase [Rothia sp. (in: high G+C Gram-positive bacteria)]|nr:biotin--[acetyl-CoA-carboxylase] ligase [Rothia sp. (in: high G+C Gram-positive bacteria)]
MPHLDPARVQLPGYDRVEILDQVGSTNDYGKQILTSDALARRSWGELSLVSTADQNAGHGRLERVWCAPAGTALATTFILRPHVNPHRRVAPEQYHWFTSLAALAVCHTLCDLFGLAPTIKWPNDVLVGNRKICGILAQLVLEPEGSISVLVGVGINLNMTAEQLPVPTATSVLVENGRVGGIAEVLNTFATHFEMLYRGFASTLFEAEQPFLGASLLERLRGRMGTIGSHLTIHLPGGETFRGIGLDISDTGELIVRADNGETRQFTVGDVVHVRPDGYGR